MDVSVLAGIGSAIPVVRSSEPGGKKTKEGDTTVSENGRSITIEKSIAKVSAKSVKDTASCDILPTISTHGEDASEEEVEKVHGESCEKPGLRIDTISAKGD